MEIEEVVVEIVMGLFLLFLSYQVGIKGIGSLLVSIGVIAMPIINLISHSELGYYIGLTLIVVGVFYIIFIIVKYNGKLISFKK